jgi:hypothetical protein
VAGAGDAASGFEDECGGGFGGVAGELGFDADAVGADKSSVKLSGHSGQYGDHPIEGIAERVPFDLPVLSEVFDNYPLRLLCSSRERGVTCADVAI